MTPPGMNTKERKVGGVAERDTRRMMLRGNSIFGSYTTQDMLPNSAGTSKFGDWQSRRITTATRSEDAETTDSGGEAGNSEKDYGEMFAEKSIGTEDIQVEEQDHGHPFPKTRLQKLKRKVSHAYFVPVFLIALGILSALLGFCMDAAIAFLHNTRVYLSGDKPGELFYANVTAGEQRYSDVPRFVVWLASSSVMMAVAVFATSKLSMAAAGSGIPEMKAVLGGFDLSNFLSFRTLLAKIFGLIFALGSGASIGKEGPFVHTSSAIAEALTKIPLFKRIRHNEALKSQLLAAGCAVGVASNFGAPVGGVLFSVEVTSTYYMVSQYWKGFFAAIAGAIVFRAIESSTSEVCWACAFKKMIQFVCAGRDA
uniref:Chloride channel protein n=1 Tax=Palpitomonas bilix TaxID=652834 RepID=A0A7S3G824_9EUKA|mmetsp:Transcript_33960/g.87191  ORF Transcript_33960/g.87191 Transcript_33960/m.87191 type:complete len:368 (+) Transcript_33960:263-1366(+)